MSTFEKFSNRNLILAQYLERIAARHRAGWLEPWGHASPELRKLLAAQEKLLNAAEQLFEKLDPSTHLDRIKAA